MDRVGLLDGGGCIRYNILVVLKREGDETLPSEE